jgi:hypothetical protein
MEASPRAYKSKPTLKTGDVLSLLEGLNKVVKDFIIIIP